MECNIPSAVLDEIALEGLEGITISGNQIILNVIARLPGSPGSFAYVLTVCVLHLLMPQPCGFDYLFGRISTSHWMMQRRKQSGGSSVLMMQSKPSLLTNPDDPWSFSIVMIILTQNWNQFVNQ
jgi:hypothetical protein